MAGESPQEEIVSNCRRIACLVSAILACTSIATEAALSFYLNGVPAGPAAAFSIADPLPTLGVYSDLGGMRTGRVLGRGYYTDLANPRANYPVTGPNGVDFSPAVGKYLNRGFTFQTFSQASPGLQMFMDMRSSGPAFFTLTAWRDDGWFDVPDDILHIYQGGAPGFYVDWVDCDLGGPYQIHPGESLVLDATNTELHQSDGWGDYWTSMLDPSTPAYWSIGGVKVAFYAQTELSYEQLINGLNLGPGTYPLTLQIEDFMVNASGATTIQIVPEAGTGIVLLAGMVWTTSRRRMR
jgi:hypothetical protein